MYLGPHARGASHLLDALLEKRKGKKESNRIIGKKKPRPIVISRVLLVISSGGGEGTSGTSADVPNIGL